MVDVNKPPTTTVARGRCVSAPTPVDNSIGSKPRMDVLAVIRTGVTRSLQPRRTASGKFAPAERRSLMKLTSTIPFSIATPNTVIKPMTDGTEMYWLVMYSAIRPPHAANGTFAMIKVAYFTESKAVYNKIKMKRIVKGTINDRRCIARC